MGGVGHLALHHEHVPPCGSVGRLGTQQHVIGAFKLVAAGQGHHARHKALAVLIVGTSRAGIDRGHAFAHLLQQCVLTVARTNVGQTGRRL